MLVKKRWAWLMSVVLLGFLASADGHEKDCSVTIATIDEAFTVNHGKRENLQEPSPKVPDAYIMVENLGKPVISTKTKGEDFEDKVVEEPKKDVEVVKDKPTEPQGFPYAIDSPPSMTRVAAMLSYCAYHASNSMDECKEFWKESCDKEAFHQFQLDGMNVMTVCKNDNQIYVAFAGTQSWNDGLVDASFLSSTMNFSKKSLFGHGGFIERSKRYGGWVKDKLSSIEGIKEKEVVLTGHSLGAALATLLAHDVYEGLKLNARGGASNSLNQVKVIGFGSPSTLLDPSSYFLGHLNHIRFYNPHDPVATTLSWLSGYGHVGVELAIPDRPARHLVRAAPLLSMHSSLKLLRHLPISYWNSLPPLTRSHLDLGIDAHSMYAYAILADATFSEYQKERRIQKSLISLENAENAITKRIDAPTSCSLGEDRVVCSSGGKIVAKFRYMMDTLPSDYQADACMSIITTTNSIPGVTVNAGMTIGNNMSPFTAASEALVLDISAQDKWYQQLPTRIFTSLYLDGHSPLPTMCNRAPSFLEAAQTLPTERSLNRKFIQAPNLFTLTKNHTTSESDTIKRVQGDLDFFGDASEAGWMDCTLPENETFCPRPCRDVQACSRMKYLTTDSDGVDHWVSLSANPSVKWGDGSNGDSWKFTVTEKRTSWFSLLRYPPQATFMVVRDDPEEYIRYSS